MFKKEIVKEAKKEVEAEKQMEESEQMKMACVSNSGSSLSGLVSQ